MNLDETNGEGFCKHGGHFTSPVPCNACISERTGVYSDYGGYGGKWNPEKEGPIFCLLCDRELGQEDFDAILAARKARGRGEENYVRAFGEIDYGRGGGLEEYAPPTVKRLVVDHCEPCRPNCVRCTRSDAGLCPDDGCVLPRNHRRKEGSKHRDKDGNEWSFMFPDGEKM